MTKPALVDFGTARIGIDLGGTKIAGAVLSGDLNPQCYRRLPTPRDDYPATVAAICDLVANLTRDWFAQSNARDQRALPVGIGTPGSCSAVTGAMSNCNSTWLNGQLLQRDLETELGQPVTLANDADCFALAQWQLQRNRPPALARNALLFGVILGTGVGGGWCQGGALRVGPNQLAGEWGHTPLPYLGRETLESRLPDRACYCGRANCIETFLSGPGLLHTHRVLWGTAVPERDAAEIFAANDSQSVATTELYCEMLARSLGQVINTVDPDVIVLGGGLSNARLLYDALPQRLPAYLFDRVELRTPVLAPLAGADSGVVGAALLGDGSITQEL